MKILLVSEPPNFNSVDAKELFFCEPLALEYIAAGVQESHDVKILDLRVEPETAFKDTLESFKPDIIGCGGTTIDVNPAKKILAEAKKILPGILTVVGGHHATVMPRDFFEDYIDVVVKGEGVYPFKKICEYYETKKSFTDIENIYFRNGKEWKQSNTSKELFISFDSLPFPARELTSLVRGSYVWPRKTELTPFATMLSSMGCIYRCKFCAVSHLMKYKVLYRQVDRIIEELESIKESCIFWVDDEFLLNPERAILLAKEIDKAGIKMDHFFEARTDTIVKNPKCIEEWAKIGLKIVFVGMESHKQDDLKKMKKGTNLSKNEESIRICQANGVSVRGGFIVMPDYDAQDFKSLAKYVRKTDLDLPSFTVWTPLPGTPLYEEEKDNLITNNYDFFDMIHTVLPTKLPMRKFFKEFFQLHSRSFTLKKKITLMKEANPKLLRIGRKLQIKMKNAYRDYDKSLW